MKTDEILDARDPEALADLTLWLEFLYRCYYRVTTDGWEHLAAPDPMLLVAQHSGGLAAPDVSVLLRDWLRHFGTRRPVYGLMQAEVFRSLRAARQVARYGAIPAEPKAAIAALRRQTSVLVFPGGVRDVFRPYTERHRIQLAGRTGFIKLALRENVPVVPIVAAGAHETFVVLGDAWPLLEALRSRGWPVPEPPFADPADNVFPIYLGLPWGVGCGAVPHLPWPARIRTRVCPPIHFERSGREALRDRAYVAACYERVRAQMQAALDELTRAGND